jgi:hypothetical protein
MAGLADTQKEAFRKYLDSAGVIDALTKGPKEGLNKNSSSFITYADNSRICSTSIVV